MENTGIKALIAYGSLGDNHGHGEDAAIFAPTINLVALTVTFPRKNGVQLIVVEWDAIRRA